MQYFGRVESSLSKTLICIFTKLDLVTILTRLNMACSSLGQFCCLLILKAQEEGKTNNLNEFFHILAQEKEKKAEHLFWDTVVTNDSWDNWLCCCCGTCKMSRSSSIDLNCKLKSCKLSTISVLGSKYQVRYIIFLDLVLIYYTEAQNFNFASSTEGGWGWQIMHSCFLSFCYCKPWYVRCIMHLSWSNTNAWSNRGDFSSMCWWMNGRQWLGLGHDVTDAVKVWWDKEAGNKFISPVCKFYKQHIT